MTEREENKLSSSQGQVAEGGAPTSSLVGGGKGGRHGLRPSSMTAQGQRRNAGTIARSLAGSYAASGGNHPNSWESSEAGHATVRKGKRSGGKNDGRKREGRFL